ncbi:MAG: T9SS type A sorting domain-containing protein [Lewinellaceae bacterium]|nr:T9SS type A sorting domain-containing protein [Saprospiraceae bacterium]MCB9333070.1 T9SS type A sorting domain-containing protein [Lewinellaceae bacterium]
MKSTCLLCFFTLLFAATGIAQTCSSSIGAKILDTGNAIEQAQDFLWTADGELLLTGFTTNPTTGEDAFLIKMTPAGSVTWAYTIGGTGDERIQKIKQCTDGGYILSGRSNSFSTQYSMFLVKMTSDGTISWARVYENTQSSEGYDVIETSDGGFAFVGFVNGIDKTGVVRTDATGLPVWGKVLNGSSNDYLFGLAETADGGLITAGSGFSFSSGLQDFLLIRFANNGNVLWQRQLGSPSVHDGLYNLKPTPDGGFIITGNTWEHSNGQFNSVPLLKLDEKGELVWAKQYGVEGIANSCFDMEVNPDGSFLLAINEHQDGPRDYLAQFDAQGNLQWARGFEHPYKVKFFGAQISTGGCLAAVGRIEDETGSDNIIIWDADSSSCSYTPDVYTDDFPLVLKTASLNVVNWTSSKAVTPEVNTLNFQVKTACNCVSPVLDLGPDILLCQDSTIVFDAGPGFVSYLWQDGSSAQTFATSSAGIYWVEAVDTCGIIQRDTVLLTLSLLTDIKLADTSLCAGGSFTLSLPGFDTYAWAPATGISCTDCPTVTFQPTSTTTYTLLATTASGCILADTFTISVLNPGPTLDLGPLVILCQDSTVVFDAGPGFVTYLWQDGSTAQTFAASNFGTYWVEVADSCGIIQRDSVSITPSLLGDIKLADTSLCVGESYTLSVPGFDNYTWAPPTGLSCSDCPTVTFQPDVTTTYTVLATTLDGCILEDTFTIEVLQPGPTLELGPTVVLCQDSTVVFDAGPGFVAYLWQDGSTAQTFAADAAGIYWVEVTDSCGMVQYDTVVLTLSLVADIKLADTTLCAGESYTLTVSGFDSYAWVPSDGLSCSDCPTVTFQPLTTTTYSLFATTVNGCVLDDSFTVTVILLEVITDTLEFCPGDTIMLGGQIYTQPTVITDTIPDPSGGCPTVFVHVLRYATAPNTAITIDCIEDINIATLAGTGEIPVVYDLPIATSTCPCPGVQLTRTEGLPSGSLFPAKKNRVCYEARDSCGNVDSCCFSIIVREALPCDVKEIGCMRWELLRITQNAVKELTYRIRVINKCPEPMIYAVFELPVGTVAVNPPDNSIYTAPSGRDYQTRNPNFNPVYSVRFKSLSDSIANGEADIFEYTLSTQSGPNYIHVLARLVPQQLFEAYLNTFNCPVQPGFKPEFEGDNWEFGIGKNELHVFPNPTTGTLFADLSNYRDQEVQLRILDARGKLVQQIQVLADAAPQPVPLLRDLPEGLYVLEMSTRSGERQAVRFVLQR